MKKINIIKDNKAITLTDVVVGIVILILFVGVFSTAFYSIYKYNVDVKLDAVAAGYVVKIAEYIDLIAYDEVTNDLNESINTTIDLPEGFNTSIEVEDYTDTHSNTEDIVKTVTIKINYSLLGETNTYSVRKIKIKEL